MKARNKVEIIYQYPLSGKENHESITRMRQQISSVFVYCPYQKSEIVLSIIAYSMENLIKRKYFGEVMDRANYGVEIILMKWSDLCERLGSSMGEFWPG